MKDTYSKPIYGTENGIPSKNFTEMVWWQLAADDAVLDPYKLLLTKLEGDEPDDEAEGINQGGAASYAYLRLQFEDIQPSERLAIQQALLRYCELDTLAMVVILQAWISNF